MRRRLASRFIAAILLAAILGGCTTVFFQPNRVSYLTPEQAKLTYDDVTIADPYGPDLHAWWFPAQLTDEYADAPPVGEQSKGTILFLHGNAQNISSHIAGVHWLPKVGYNMLMLDYRGYGKSAGAAHLPGALQDVERALAWLDQRGELTPENKVIVYGQSLGGALSLLATARSDYRGVIDGLVTESAFSSFRGITREKLGEVKILSWFKWPLSWLITRRERPLEAIAALSPMPVLIMHGKKDVAVPAHHGEALFAAAKQPKTLWLAEDARHIEMAQQPEWRQRLLQWLADLPSNSL